jgi:6-phosphogluconolactonase
VSETLLYIGTYTNKDEPKSEGVYVYRLDPDTGALSPHAAPAPSVNPSFVALHPQGTHLYAVNEIGEFNGKPAGGVSSFAIDAASGGLRFLNQQSTVGTGPCHLSIDATGTSVLVANYGGGSVAALPIQTDGSLGEASDFVQHQGSSVNQNRQKEPHAHSIMLSPDNRFAFAPDLGMDQIVAYRLENGKLAPHTPAGPRTQPGAGPRHFDFHPNRRFAYVINEIDNTVIAYAYDAEAGGLNPIQTMSTLPTDFDGTSHTADIHVSPDGRFLYGSNRGHDSIAIYEIDQDSGQLEARGHVLSGGKGPRNFALSPDGRFLFAAHHNTDDIHTFRVNLNDGSLEPTGQVTHVSAPVCLKFLVR